MKSSHSISKLFLALYISVIIIGGFAQAQSAEEFTPEVGQAGKDVVWVPTPQTLVDKMLDMANVTPEDYVIDLGSGDGRIVISAAKRGANAHGIEYNPEMVELSKRNAAKEGVSDKAKFFEADLFKSDLSQATVITMFLLQEINMELRPKILDLKPGTRIVSNTFDMGKWEADKIATAEEDCRHYCTAYFWVVPAKVEGTWKMPQGELTLDQTFQRFTGVLRSGDEIIPVRGRLTGYDIIFAAEGKLYAGRVNGNSMEGEIRGISNSRWSATRSNQ